MPHQLTKSDVLEAAEYMMQQNGQTTTLEVKNKLRSDSFFATQQVVSAFMEELCAEMGWQFENTGKFRIYFKPRQVDQQILNLLFSSN